MNKSVKLDSYNNEWYDPGGKIKRIVWYLINMFFFKTMLPFPSQIKTALLRVFGAKVGKNVIIKSDVNIKYPWFLSVGNNVWIGENVWIDNLTYVTIKDDVVLSQGCYLLTGSHDYKKETFDLKIDAIILENGVWVGAKATVSPGVVCQTHSVLTLGSVAAQDLDAYGVYQGNPALKKKERMIS